MADAKSRVIIAGEDRTAAAFRSAIRNAEGASKRISGALRNAFPSVGAGFGAAFSAAGIVGFSTAIVEASDKIKSLTQRLETFSGDSRAFAKAREAAQQLGVSVDSVADGMTRLLVTGKAVGITSDTARQLAVTFMQLGRLGGSSAEEANRAFVQLTQGIGKGVLQGQDLKSVMSDVPLVAQAIAKELGVATGQLPKMGEEGRITADVIVRAMKNASAETQAAFAKLPETIEQQKARLANAWQGALAAMDNQLHQSDTWKFITGRLTVGLENIEKKLSTDVRQVVANDLAELQRVLKAASEGSQIAGANKLGPSSVITSERFGSKTLAELVELRNTLVQIQEGYRKADEAASKLADSEAAAAAKGARAEQLKQAREQLAQFGEPAEKITAAFNKQKQQLEQLAVTYPELAGEVGRAIANITDEFENSLRSANAEMVRFQMQASTMRGDAARMAAPVPGSGLGNNELEINAAMERIRQKSAETFEGFENNATRAFKETSDEMSVFADQAARNMQDAFAQFLFDPFKDGLRGMLKSFIDTIRQMLANQAAKELFAWLGSKAGGGGILGFLGGLFGGERAAGGPVQGGRVHLVGEKGPELFVPTGSGRIVPNHAMSQQRAVTIAPTYKIDARGATADLAKALPGILQENNRQLLDLIRDQRARGAMA